MSLHILGVNTAYHESSACLLRDGEIVAIAEEERFNRFRHGKHSRVDNPDELPEQAIAWCLRQGGIGWKEVAAIGYSFDPEERRRRSLNLPDAGRVRPGDWGTPEGEETFYRHSLAARDKLVARAPQARFRFLSHHLCHAASAFLVSPFEQAAVLVVDGIGEFNSTWLGLGQGNKLTELEVVGYPHSLGFVWERMSEFLGFDVYSGPGKVMGYAALTDPIGELTGADFLSRMRTILHEESGGTFRVDGEAFRFRTDDFSGLERLFGPRRAAVVDRYEDASVAAALQAVTQDIMAHLARRLYERVNAGRKEPVVNLCLAGGVALNCVANYQVALRAPFKRIWVQPMANDAGTALGAAALMHFEEGGTTRPRMLHPFWGPEYSPDEMLRALKARGLAFSKPDNVAAEVAARVERGQIVAWFQGRQEVGPRALGHRSIITDPSRFDARSRLNARVKYRESFRPFAPSVLPAGMAEFFELPVEMLSTRYMLFALPLRQPRMKQMIPAVVQENGSTGQAGARAHEVQPEADPLYAELIGEFEKKTGLPMVLNTSFNIGEPIVTSPDQALDTFLRSSMEALALGPFVAPHPKSK
ncbi:MAG TPA: carbamoyltransferase C-terminal domain-containing protein [Verrucomicrobiota bacterium]|nr:carbamoyltransferase C-terminal domain-containing protein [Verrucomicrobiota bacterium]HQL80366.1 carbamoyltransferase C-terminal domain-containing protein [Verrucomicrobiota bacterium]